MGPYSLFATFILLGCSGIYPILAAIPDLVVRLSPVANSPSELLAVNSDVDDNSIEILAKRAQFGSRESLLKGRLVRAPGYDHFLCERFRTTYDVEENGHVNVVTLPPYKKPEEGNSTVMLVPRGECSFERKAYAAKHFYGAKGARYTWNETSNRVNFPQAKWDYECANGNSMLYDLPLDPPAYNETQLDPVMGFTTKMPIAPVSNDGGSSGEETNAVSSVGTTTVCDLTNTALNSCESQLCLVTSHLENTTNYPVCCAWDTPLTMPDADDAKDLNTDDILAVWLTIRQGELIFQSDLLSFGTEVTIQRRGSSSAFNVSYIFMWIWGTLVTMAGAWYSAGHYRRFNAKLTAYKASGGSTRNGNRSSGQRRPRPKKSGRSKDHTAGESDGPENLNSTSSNAKNKRVESNNEEPHRDLETGNRSLQVEMDGKVVGRNPKQMNRKKNNITSKKRGKRTTEKSKESWSLRSLPPPERKRKVKTPLRNKNNWQGDDRGVNQPNAEGDFGNESSMVPPRDSSSISSLEFSLLHAIALVVVASSFLILLYFFPRLYTIVFILWGLGCAAATSYLIISPLINTVIPKLGDNWVEELKKPVMCGCNGFAITCNLITYIWAGVWIWYGITHYRPQTNAFFWLTLNIFGACVCILSVMVLKLTSIKIATFLMVAIFVYDVFFVFITPFITGGVSVMLKVASGSENPSAGEICYRYPEDCKGVGFLPMLFILPKINDYANGTVILGLGDIFWPGFLVAFCARHDEAARLLGVHAPFPDIKYPTKWYEGYLFPMMIAYSMGLFFAFLAVILTEEGQPALLYICPLCLSTIFILGRNELKDLWNGSKVLKLADGLVNKTERHWGKARMKQFGERVRRQNTDRASGAKSELGSERYATGRSENVSENPKANTKGSIPSSNPTRPRSRDVCFGYEDHPGTRAFRKVVEEVANDLGEEEYKPEVYKLIRKKLKERRFFMTNKIVWVEASKLETRKEIGKAYDLARGRRSRVFKHSDPLTAGKII